MSINSYLVRNKKKNKSKKKKSYRKNIDNGELKICSLNPMTGFYRNGYCMTGDDDLGTHTVCAKMDNEFLNYTKNKGNDLSSVVKSGDNWCLCEYRWNEAFLDGKAPSVIRQATNMRTKKHIQKNINKTKRGGNKTKKATKRNYTKTKKKKELFFEKYDLYSDANPKDTIRIKYKTLNDVKSTIHKLEKLYKSNQYKHSRISQVANVMTQRLRVINENDKRYKLSLKYYNFLKKRTKIKIEKERKQLIFK